MFVPTPVAANLGPAGMTPNGIELVLAEVRKHSGE